MYHRIIYLIIAAFFPLIASAQLGGGEYDRVIEVLTRSLNLAIVFLFLVATVILIWGIVKYIGSGGDEAKREEAHNLIIWGIIFLAVMVAVWGFVYIVLDFIFDRESPVDIPGGTSGVPQQR
jgi:Na+-driven multidrug efflux pump